ncbi:MAG: hypothetical protein BWX44_01305 [Spirochaetes bacterium ADurb.Bin001]|nr:MAG: hypothetical protein BWX44_01305 [Spirochaetes bacterium ADurb.Bin001]
MVAGASPKARASNEKDNPAAQSFIWKFSSDVLFQRVSKNGASSKPFRSKASEISRNNSWGENGISTFVIKLEFTAFLVAILLNPSYLDSMNSWLLSDTFEKARNLGLTHLESNPPWREPCKPTAFFNPTEFSAKAPIYAEYHGWIEGPDFSYFLGISVWKNAHVCQFAIEKSILKKISPPI